MLTDYLTQLYDYNDWANRQVWDCVSKLDDETYFQSSEFSVGSVYSQLIHTMAVEYWWGGYLQTGTIGFLSDEEIETYRDRAAFRSRWDDISAANRAYVATLTPDDLARLVHPDFWDDDDPSITVAQALTQVANHSLDHRSQLMALLHQLGHEGAGQDFLTYLHTLKK